MRKLALLLVLIIAIPALIASCSKQTTEPEPAEIILSPGPADKTAEQDRQYYLSRIYEAAEAAVYDVIAFTVTWSDGGFFYDNPSTWEARYPQYYFGLEFDPQSWDQAVYGDELAIEIRVPNLGTFFGCSDAPMFFELHAVGYPNIQFTKPVMLHYSIHPALDPWCGYQLIFNYDKDDVTGEFFISEEVDVLPKGKEPFLFKPECAVGRSASINHFSRWGQKNETEPPPDRGPNYNPYVWPCR